MKITITKTFNIINTTLAEPVEVKFMNRKGSFEVVQFTKYRTIDVKNTAVTYKAGKNTKNSRFNSTKTITYNSVWFTEDYYPVIEDLLVSPVILINNKQVRLLNNSYKHDNIEKVFSIEIEVAEELTQNNIRL